MDTTPRQLKLKSQTLLKKASWSDWLDGFNQVHNATITTSVGKIKVVIDD